MEEENEDFQKKMGKFLEDYQKKINDFGRRIDVLEEYMKWLEEYKDLAMPRTTLDKTGDGRKIV